MTHFPWRSALAALAVVAGVWLFYSAQETTLPLAPSALPAVAGPGDMPRVTVRLDRLNKMITAMAMHHTNPPPWYRGNLLTISDMTNLPSGLPPGQWRLANMHSENFHEFVQREKIDRLELGLLSNHLCLVTDPRVPTEWLLHTPNFASLTRGRTLKKQYAAYFSRHPLLNQLPRHRWILTRREDPDGLLAQVLPGEALQFISDELTCFAANGAPRGTRQWDPSGEAPDFYLAAREILTNNTYTGAGFKVTLQADNLRLVPTSKNHSDGTSTYGEMYPGKAFAEYRAE